jgi:ankyrin repeat protein
MPSLLWMLLEHRPGAAEVDAKTRHGFTPLHIAATHGYALVVWLLLEKGADPTQQDTTGCTPLHCAAAAGYVEVSRLLLASQRGGITLAGILDHEMRTALHAAASGGYPETVQALLDGGALPVIDARDDKGYTPLRLAVRKRDLHVVLCLVKWGADVNMVNKKGRTVLHLAMYDGDAEIIKALLGAENVDQTIKDSKGLTARDVAERRRCDVNNLEPQVYCEE